MPADAYAIVERVVVALVVLGAVVFLYLQWSGTFAKWRDRRRPDVKVSSLIRASKGETPPPPPPPTDDCCR